MNAILAALPSAHELDQITIGLVMYACIMGAAYACCWILDKRLPPRWLLTKNEAVETEPKTFN